jgi:hypothetical protein
MSLAGASKHVRVLEGAGLLRREVHGNTHICHLKPAALVGAYRWLAFYELLWSR